MVERLMDLSEWIETMHGIKLQPWQKTYLLQLQQAADRIIKEKTK